MEFAVLLGFVALLALGMVASIPLPVTLTAGFAMFFLYGIARGKHAKDLLRLSLEGVRKVGGILVLFVIVGAITATWRAAGTIPMIVTLATHVVGPSTIVLASFLLCCLMSMLMGTAFGTAATMGVICMTIGNALGANPALLGGAILAGAYFGDRCSPVSSSAALVATLTKTSLFDNVSRMLRTASVPFALACAAYLVAGLVGANGGSMPDVQALFQQSFQLSPLCVLPAVVVVALSLARVDVKVTMLASLACAVAVCVGVQGVDPASLPALLMFGYASHNAAIAHMVDGGGILSMANVVLVICISSTYSGLFEGTGLLDGLRAQVLRMGRASTPFTSVLATSLAASCVSCNQTLAIMLTDQLCDGIDQPNGELAIELENSVVTCAALMPWSIAATATLSFVGAPSISILAACFLYLLPLWTLALSVVEHVRPGVVRTRSARALGLAA